MISAPPTLTRALAGRLGAPAVLSTLSRLVIDPNRGLEDPTLVMRFPTARSFRATLTRCRGDRSPDRAILAPYRRAIRATVDAMIATGEPPAIVSIHFVHHRSGGDSPVRGRLGSHGIAIELYSKPPMKALLRRSPIFWRREIGDRTNRMTAFPAEHDRCHRHFAGLRRRADRDPARTDRRKEGSAGMGRTHRRVFCRPSRPR